MYDGIELTEYEAIIQRNFGVGEMVVGPVIGEINNIPVITDIPRIR